MDGEKAKQSGPCQVGLIFGYLGIDGIEMKCKNVLCTVEQQPTFLPIRLQSMRIDVSCKVKPSFLHEGSV